MARCFVLWEASTMVKLFAQARSQHRSLPVPVKVAMCMRRTLIQLRTLLRAAMARGQDVYDDYTFKGRTPVACCDGQAPANQHGKMVCPAKPCANPGQDVYDDYTFKGHTPVHCCDGQKAANQNGKMLCPGGASPNPWLPAKPCANPDLGSLLI
eukprot:TRINITY_DN1327_c0_g1_i4.p1 TRINITY_DN1327_c0_g1~~TRINITY_DN1327_c0_g1_i4.p1  ORF type:complete len:154 (+),score=27.17 TRINITY_DN1327_c0_g1_i4:188-649(+)